MLEAGTVNTNSSAYFKDFVCGDFPVSYAHTWGAVDALTAGYITITVGIGSITAGMGTSITQWIPLII